MKKKAVIGITIAAIGIGMPSSMIMSLLPYPIVRDDKSQRGRQRNPLFCYKILFFLTLE
jgi:hypothetical protein